MRIMVFILFNLLYGSLTVADVTLPAIFSDNMVLQRDSEVLLWGWADSSENIEIKPSWHSSSKTYTCKADINGKWELKIVTPEAGGPFQIIIKAKNVIKLENILSGEVWICSGQSNMQWPLNKTEYAKTRIAEANFSNIRLFTVAKGIAPKPLDNCKGLWLKCSSETVENFSAVAYFFGKRLHEELKGVPIGLICSTWGGTKAEAWTKKEVLAEKEDLVCILKEYDQWVANFEEREKDYAKSFKEWQEGVGNAKISGQNEPRAPTKPKLRNENSPSSLYNAMIAPIIPFKIKGVIWYQGEANVNKAYQYKTLFPAMINGWRDSWNIGEFPFYFVQIAPYRRQSPEIRYAQMLTMQMVPNTGMVVTTDIGNSDDIHPRNKIDVGNRLALWALARNYGREDLVCSGPIYKSMKIEKHTFSLGETANIQNSRKCIRLFFDSIGSGLVAVGGDLTDFTIAGANKEFVNAQAIIDNDTILVFSDEVKEPVAVRFAWTNTAQPNFFNREGLPASPFKTDNWRWQTQ